MIKKAILGLLVLFLVGSLFLLFIKTSNKGFFNERPKNNPIDTVNPTPSSPNYIQEEKLIEKIWNSQTGDINGDGRKEIVELVGKISSNPDFPPSNRGNLMLKIYDYETYKLVFQKEGIFEEYGLSPFCNLGDINRDGSKEILVSMNSGGNGYGYIYYKLFSLKAGLLKEIPLDSIREEIGKRIHFSPYGDEKVELIVDGIDKNFIIPLSRFESIVYKKIRNKYKEFIGRGFGYYTGDYFEIGDFNRDGLDELKCEYLFVAEYHYEIARLIILYKNSGNNWTPLSAEVEPFYESKSQSDKEKYLLRRDIKNKNGSVINFPRGLKNGDSKTRVEQLFGKHDEDTSDDLQSSWEYYTEELDSLRISFKGDVVSEINIELKNN